MQEITRLEGRITAALERIGKGVDRLAATPRPATPEAPPPVAPSPVATPPADAALRSQLEEQKTQIAALQDRLRSLKDREPKGDLQEKVERLTQQLDVQGLELQRMRRTNSALREQLATLRSASMTGVTEPHLINKSLMAELEALRAIRLSEVAEMDEILAALEPHLTEARHA
jgi:predicted RNase H-like nuclease (RuvC/YqgF family)